MQCPVDGERLVMAERSGVEIDYCPKCRGVWLDRGELDKIVERSAGAPGARGGEDRHDLHHRDRDRAYGKHKKESFLSNLFDF